MKRERLIVCLLLLIVTAFPASGFARQQDNETVSLLRYISVAGANIGCRFTVEYLRADWMSPSLLEVIQLPNTAGKIRTLEDVVDNLKKYLPNAIVWEDKDNPMIIHLMERGLSKMPDYVMTKEGDFHYDGLLRNLPQKLGDARKLPLATPKSGDLNMLNVLDFSTKVHFNASKESVRSILSNHMLVTHRSMILWTAMTFQNDPQHETTVSYYR